MRQNYERNHSNIVYISKEQGQSHRFQSLASKFNRNIYLYYYHGIVLFSGPKTKQLPGPPLPHQIHLLPSPRYLRLLTTRERKRERSTAEEEITKLAAAGQPDQRRGEAMDTEPEELQFLGFLGIFREARNILLSWKKIFSNIALSLVLPLSFIFLLHIEISDLIFAKIDRNLETLDETASGSRAEGRILDRLAAEWASYAAFKAAYLLLVLVLSLLSTSAVVYTVACVYTAKEMTFRKVLTVVPKVWRRLLVTFLWSFAFLFAYNSAAILILFLCLLLVGTGAAGASVGIALFPAYLAGLVYISVVWHLASAISVLEDMYGLAAMQKSKALIKGKAWVASCIFLLFHLSFVAIEVGFARLVVHGRWLGAWPRLGYAAVFLSLLSLLVLVALVMQTIIYFVCKSYHHESIDKSSLADHLEVYLGEYTPLKGRDVQLEQYYDV